MEVKRFARDNRQFDGVRASLRALIREHPYLTDLNRKLDTLDEDGRDDLLDDLALVAHAGVMLSK